MTGFKSKREAAQAGSVTKLVEEMQRMAKRNEDLEAMLERQTARIVDLQTHIENLEGEKHMNIL